MEGLAFNICKQITWQHWCDTIHWSNTYNYCRAHFFYSGYLVPLTAILSYVHLSMVAMRWIIDTCDPILTEVGPLACITYGSYCIITTHVLNLESNSTEMSIIYGKKYLYMIEVWHLALQTFCLHMLKASHCVRYHISYC